MDPNEISATLAIQPAFQWKAGDNSVTPTGTPLKGVRRSSYWCARLFENEEILDLPESLHQHVSQLQKHSLFLDNIRATGGAIEYFIGWFVDSSSGAEFGWPLLEQLGTLGINLSFDAYGSSADPQE